MNLKKKNVQEQTNTDFIVCLLHLGHCKTCSRFPWCSARCRVLLASHGIHLCPAGFLSQCSVWSPLCLQTCERLLEFLCCFSPGPAPYKELCLSFPHKETDIVLCSHVEEMKSMWRQEVSESVIRKDSLRHRKQKIRAETASGDSGVYSATLSSCKCGQVCRVYRLKSLFLTRAWSGCVLYLLACCSVA